MVSIASPGRCATRCTLYSNFGALFIDRAFVEPMNMQLETIVTMTTASSSEHVRSMEMTFQFWRATGELKSSTCTSVFIQSMDFNKG